MGNHLKEMSPTNISLESFEMKDELNPKFWVDDKLNSKVRLRLMDIADDFMDSLSMDWVTPNDYILTGSIANYNWSEYSDIDLHIQIDFSKVYKKNTDFVEDYFDSKKNAWNSEHEDLTIYGYPVEIYVEDTKAERSDNGRYSLYKNKWISEPTDLEDAKMNGEFIKKKAKSLISKIDSAEKVIKGKDAHKAEKQADKISDMMDKLRNDRTKGLKSKNGDLSSSNVIYKILRRTGYCDKVRDLKHQAYDKVNSINESKYNGKVSCGILPYRRLKNGKIQVLLGFPGQPSSPTKNLPKWMNRWMIIRGHLQKGESMKDCAVREFCEECGIEKSKVNKNKLFPLGKKTIDGGRKMYCFAFDVTGNDNFKRTSEFHSNMVDNFDYIMQNNGKTYPEIAKFSWIDTDSITDMQNSEKSFIKMAIDLKEK